jgi:hypothetical protein
MTALDRWKFVRRCQSENNKKSKFGKIIMITLGKARIHVCENSATGAMR